MKQVKYYAGIGSRQTPSDIAKVMTKISGILEKKDYILRSGGARGADSAFANGLKRPKVNAEYFTPHDQIPQWAFDEVQKHYLFKDRINGFNSLAHHIKNLLARNMMIILGADGNTPVDFVICWTKTLNLYDRDIGGTGYGLRLAKSRNIPIYNLACTHTYNKFLQRILANEGNPYAH